MYLVGSTWRLKKWTLMSSLLAWLHWSACQREDGAHRTTPYVSWALIIRSSFVTFQTLHIAWPRLNSNWIGWSNNFFCQIDSNNIHQRFERRLSLAAISHDTHTFRCGWNFLPVSLFLAGLTLISWLKSWYIWREVSEHDGYQAAAARRVKSTVARACRSVLVSISKTCTTMLLNIQKCNDIGPSAWPAPSISSLVDLLSALCTACMHLFTVNLQCLRSRVCMQHVRDEAEMSSSASPGITHRLTLQKRAKRTVNALFMRFWCRRIRRIEEEKKTLTLARLLGIKTKDECARGFLSLHMLCSFPFPFSLSRWHVRYLNMPVIWKCVKTLNIIARKRAGVQRRRRGENGWHQSLVRWKFSWCSLPCSFSVVVLTTHRSSYHHHPKKKMTKKKKRSILMEMDYETRMGRKARMKNIQTCSHSRKIKMLTRNIIKYQQQSESNSGWQVINSLRVIIVLENNPEVSCKARKEEKKSERERENHFS